MINKAIVLLLVYGLIPYFITNILNFIGIGLTFFQVFYVMFLSAGILLNVKKEVN